MARYDDLDNSVIAPIELMAKPKTNVRSQLFTHPCSFHHVQSSAEPVSSQSAPGESGVRVVLQEVLQCCKNQDDVLYWSAGK